MFAIFMTAAVLFQANPPATPTETPTATPKPAETRMVCRRERVVGTLRPARICRTQAEWGHIRDAAKDMVESTKRVDTFERLEGVPDRGPQR